ncbi:hypothetical protein [Haladaptatus salinisoli]|uniref:hypothetical protein n=1 Tax=Haladaptatus salinisoli TaxID=2884876 RepID=UPI001D0A571E|nr:hypothetical protein [Haladaptatus salinisoli]
MGDKNSDFGTEQNKADDQWSTTRRRALQLAGVGVGGVAVPGFGSIDVRAASECAEGPFERTYSGATVNLARLESKRGKGKRAVDSGAKSPAGEKELEKLRAEAERGGHSEPSGRAQRAAGTGDELSIRTEYDGVNAEGTRGGVPSDSQIAAGRGKVVHALNQQVAIFNKRSGNQQLKVRLEDIFRPVIDEPEGGFAYGYPFVFDPRARYDRNAERFVLAATQYEPGITESGEIVDREELEERAEEGEEGDAEPFQRPPQGWWCLAVSDGSNPNGKWHVYRIPPVNNEGLVDYPTLGLDRDAVYLSQNFFGERFEVTMVTLDKAALYAGEAATGYHFTAMDNPEVENDDFTVQPALQPFSGGSDGTFYLLNSVFPSPTADALTLWEVTDPLDDPTLECFTVDVEKFGYPPAARQPDSDALIDTLGTRLMNLDYNDGSLWAAHSIRYDWNGDGEAVAAIKWYEIDADARKVVQSGVYGEPGTSYFIPTVGSDGDSTIIAHNVSGPDTFPRMEVAGRTAEHAPNELEDSVVVQDGESRYDYGEGYDVMRWGDYNGVSVDPTSGRFWTVSQYSPDVDVDPDAEGRDPYHTRIAEVSFDGA